ncbi:MAG: arginase family protein [Candidatus Omnitrophota bacterium]
MLNKSIRILNLDDSLTKQQKVISRYKAEIIDLSDLGPLVRLWMDKKAMDEVSLRIQGSASNSITFLGSGDFHHISNILASRFKEPFCLIVFDSHPDWDILPPSLGCGSWVTRTLRNKNILKCILLGISSSDISSWRIQTGNLGSLKDNRVEIYPYSHGPSSVFLKRIPQNISIETKKRFLYDEIYWDQIKGKDLTGFFTSILKRLPVKQVYVSIDKDCLKQEHALTNWEEGGLSLDELLLMLRLIKDNLDIIGMDITGDYSKISLAGKCKGFFSRLDHPKEINAQEFPESFITATNEEANLKILELLI